MNSMDNLLDKINNYIVHLNNSDQDWLNKHFTSSVKDVKTIGKIKMDLSQIISELPTGRKTIKLKQNLDTNSGLKKHVEKEINISNDILPFVLPLSSILTLKDVNSDFIEVLQKIKDKPKLFDIFINQMGVWYKTWNGKEPDEKRKEQLRKWMGDMIKVFSEIDGKGEWNVNNIMLQFKYSFHDLIDQPDKALEFINSCLKRHGNERDQLGEVFTPMSIIEEMFDNLDKYYKNVHGGKSIFSDKNLRWFDPASGMGNFPIALYLRLMKGLENKIPDKTVRKRHILEKMMYMSEFNKKNVFICKQLFDIGNKYKLNLYNGDTLKLNPKQEWGIDKFDVIMGNPPYNKGGVFSNKGDRTTEEYQTIWEEFTLMSLKLLEQNGYLLFITPLYWLKNKDEVHQKLLKKHIIWLTLWDNVKSQKKIGGKIPTSIYILHNIINTCKHKTFIDGQMVYLDPMDNIPLAFFSIFKKLQNFIIKYNLQLNINRKTIQSTGDSFILPRKYTLNDKLCIDTVLVNDEEPIKKVRKCIKIHPDADKRKLIIANKSGFYGMFIDYGKLGLCGSAKYYILGDDLNLIKKLIELPIFSKIVSKYTKYRQDFLDPIAFSYIPDMRKYKKKLSLEDITEEKFYKLIGLTEQEIKQIRGETSQKPLPLIKKNVEFIQKQKSTEPKNKISKKSENKTQEKVNINNKFFIKKIKPDGNCFYRAVSLFVGENHKEIRQNVVKYFLSIPKQDRQQFMISKREINQLGQDGVWNNNAGDHIPELFAKLYKMRLRIYNKRGNLKFSLGNKGKIYNLLLDGDHYSILVDKENPNEYFLLNE